MAGIFRHQGRAVQQVGPHPQRGGQRLLPPPARYGTVVPAPQYLRHFAAFQDFGPRVMGVLQQAVGKTFVVPGLLLAHEAWHQPRHGLDDGQGRRLAAIEHGFAHAHGLQRKDVQQAGIQSFVTAADQGQVFFPGQLACQRIIEGTPAGSQQDHASRLLDGAQRRGHRFALHDHAGTAAVGAVVHMMVTAGAEAAGIVERKVHDAGLAGAAQQCRLKGRAEKLREKADQMKAKHGRTVTQKRA